MIRFALEIVGGPYDGVPDLVFMGTEAELPAELRVGRCPGDWRCGMQRCIRKGHAAYWIPAIEDPPVAAVAYELDEGSVEVDDVEDDLMGKARYVMGGVPRIDRELALAGASEGIAYG